jgi:hypothetical protein
VFVNHNGERFLIAHFQSRSLSFNGLAAAEFMATEISVPPAVTIVTFATADIAAEALLPRQLDGAGIGYINPARDVAPWQNWLKIPLLLEVLPAVQTEYVLALDGRDVLLTGALDDIFARLASYPGISVLLGAQKFQYPPFAIEEFGDRQSLGAFAYINAGTVFGRTADVGRFYQRVAGVDSPSRTEQLRVRSAFAECHDEVWFDHHCRIFQTFGQASLEDCGDGLIRVN